MKVGDFLGALTATCRLNDKQVWANLRNELLKHIENEAVSLLYLYVC